VFVSQSLDVLDKDATRAAFEQRMYVNDEKKLESFRTRITAAEEKLQALDEHESVKILRAVVSEMSRESQLSPPAAELLERARLKLANRLIGIAGKKETGHAETKEGDEARTILVEAARINPDLAPSEDEFPPRFLTLFAIARKEVLDRGKGSVRVESKPQGATIFVEGRPQTAVTPVDLSLALGAHRIWVTLGDSRSKTHVIESKTPPDRIEVDLVHEGALLPDGPRLRPLRGFPIEEADAKWIGELLKVETLILVGTASYDDMHGDWVWAAAFDVAQGKRARHGAVKLDNTKVKDAAVPLANFVVGNDVEGVEDRPLPKNVLPPPKTGGDSTNLPNLSVMTKQVVEDVPWVPIAAIGGGVALLAAAGVTAWAIVEYGPRDGNFVVRVRELQ
jgi:hypothetical protein